MELTRLLVQAHLDLRALREQRRDDVTDCDGDVRGTAEPGRERGRVMVFGEVRTSRIGYRKKGKPDLYPQDAELGWGPRLLLAGLERRIARAAALAPAGQAAAQVSAACAVTVGKRQAEETALAFAADFESFYAARRPDPRPDAWAVLLTCDGSAFTVLPSALRPATAKAARDRAKKRERWPSWPPSPTSRPPRAPQKTSSPPCSAPPPARRLPPGPPPGPEPWARRCSRPLPGPPPP